MIADMHCHFPMHLVDWAEEHPRDRVRGWWERVLDRAKVEGFELAAELENDQAFGGGWRVSQEGLERGGAGLVCSVLYWPFCEFELAALRGGPPNPAAFGCLMHQLDTVERRLDEADPDRSRHVVVQRESDLDDARTRFVHCVEGGFHLGPDADSVGGQIAELAGRGVFYITLAHLFFRGVAAGAPAIPPLTDHEYNRLFHQPREGLTDLGRAAIAAMCEHSVVVDLSHMRADVIASALDELDRIDAAGTMPVIASHVGAAAAGPPDHAYNLSSETMRRVRDRGGVIGLIAAQHLLGETATAEESRELLGRHIEAIREAVGGHGHTAIGTDLDGFIKPTLAGLEKAEDLADLEQWIRALCPDGAEAILHGNAERVLRATLRRRAGLDLSGSPREGSAPAP
jgi:microsomal dipeptidase-like Zn-dependent dipeptidase